MVRLELHDKNSHIFERNRGKADWKIGRPREMRADGWTLWLLFVSKSVSGLSTVYFL